MRFYCGPTEQEKEEALIKAALEERRRQEKWHRKFLWWPKRMMEDNMCYWLQYVERRAVHTYDDYIAERKYRTPGTWDTGGTLVFFEGHWEYRLPQSL